MISGLLWKQLEKRFVFFPTSVIEYTPDDVGLDYEEVFFATEDGLRLHAWYLPGESKLTWICFHGNGGNIGHRVPELALLHHRIGVNLFIFDYRGYGRSEGIPSEQGTYRDARAALRYLQDRADTPTERMVYFGHSLGTAVAVELASFEPPSGLILVSPFASVSEMSRLVFPLLPVGWLLRNKYNSLTRIAKIHRPLLVLHGDQDETVPISHANKLFDAANHPKHIQILRGAGHNDTFEAGGQAYWEALEQFVSELGTP